MNNLNQLFQKEKHKSPIQVVTKPTDKIQLIEDVTKPTDKIQPIKDITKPIDEIKYMKDMLLILMN